MTAGIMSSLAEVLVIRFRTLLQTCLTLNIMSRVLQGKSVTVDNEWVHVVRTPTSGRYKYFADGVTCMYCDIFYFLIFKD